MAAAMSRKRTAGNGDVNPHANAGVGSGTGKKKMLNPIIESLLKDPIGFRAAKTPDKVTVKPSSYKVFRAKNGRFKQSTKSKTEGEDDDNNTNTNKNIRATRPKSMAEAIAQYAGKKYAGHASSGNKPEKKLKEKKVKEDQKERIKRLLINQNASSQSETPPTVEETPEAGSSTNSDQAVDSDAADDVDDNENADAEADADEDEEDDEEDDDFHTAESDNGSADSDDDVDGEENDEEDDDADEGDEQLSSEEQDEEVEEDEEKDKEEVDQSDDGETLKKDLKDDAINAEPSPAQSETPPTSNDELTSKQPAQLIDNNYCISEFYDLNELPHDQGSNGSTRLQKSWGDFIEGHTALGLVNHGVTCYMNAAVQSIAHIPSLTHYLIDVNNGKYDDTIKANSVTKVIASTICKMYRLGHNRKIIYINPKMLCKRLEDINCMMSEWQQEDSHEYFMSLMSRLQEDSTPKGVKLNKSIIYDIFGGLLDQTVTCKNCGHISTTQQEFYDLSLGLDNRKKRSSLLIDAKQLDQLRDQIQQCDSSDQDEKSQLSKILQQRILLARASSGSPVGESSKPNTDSKAATTQSSSSMSNNNSSSNGTTSILPPSGNSTNASQQSINNSTANTSMDGSNVVTTKRLTLENAIRDFFTPELIKTDTRDQSGYVCEKCNIKTNAIKISTIQRSPETLSIHLKRFRFNGQQSQKVKASVIYPEILDLTSYTTAMSTPTKYKLTNVIVHQGRSVSSGHYIAHCRQPNNTWATYDDEYVNKIPKASALSDPGAYVLIYERLTYKGKEGDAAAGNADVEKDTETAGAKRGRNTAVANGNSGKSNNKKRRRR